MAALPYIQLYVADYLADTAHLNAAQHGAYLLLIMNYWQRGHALNNSNERLTNVARMTSEEWEKNKPVLQEFFEVDGDTWTHRRIESDLEAVHAKSTKASSAGKASAKAKANRRSTSVEQSFNYTDTDTDTDTEERKQLSSLQAKPDPVHRLNGKKPMIAEVAGYLNLQAQRNFRIENPNGTPTAGALVIEQRLREGYTVEQCKDVIGVKSNEWMGDEKMHQFLNPETLFRKKNFTKYLAESEAQQ